VLQNPDHEAAQYAEAFNVRIVLPRFRAALTPGAYLAIVWQDTTPDPWSSSGEIIVRYRTDSYRVGWQTSDLVARLERQGLFQKVGARQIASIVFEQTIGDYLASYHSRAGFSRERLDAKRTAAFQQKAREVLLTAYPGGKITFRVVWGIPALSSLDVH
jgi:hypothetical protein